RLPPARRRDGDALLPPRPGARLRRGGRERHRPLRCVLPPPARARRLRRAVAVRVHVRVARPRRARARADRGRGGVVLRRDALTSVWDVIAAEAADESALWAEALLPEDRRELDPIFSPLGEERHALGLETIYEG